MSYRLTGEIGVKGLPPVRMQGMMAQNEVFPGTINAALLVNDRFSKVYENALEQPVVTGLKLKVEAIPARMTAVLESARLSRIEAHAGDEIEVEATLHPYQAEARMVRVKVKLPAELTPGTMRVVVSDGATVDRLTTRTGPQHAVGSGGYGGGAEPDACERPGVCDAAGPCGAGGAGGRGVAGGAAFDGECTGAVEGRAEDAVDGGERGGGGVGRGGICGERVAGVELLVK